MKLHIGISAIKEEEREKVEAAECGSVRYK
jgi:hypothetical protein